MAGGGIAATVAFTGAAAFVILRGGFGAADLAAFAFWCAMLGAVVGAAGAALARGALPARRAVRAALGAGLGIVLGVVFTLAAALGLGGWIGAFSFPVLPLWGAGGAAGLGWALANTAPRVGARGAPVWRGLAVVAGALAAVAALPIVLLYGSAYVWGRAEPEVHLIPAGFRGPVLIVYGQPRGAVPAREGRARRYAIPAHGVLRTQYGPNPGWSKPRYFYVDAAGRRSAIVGGLPCADSLPGDPVQACLMGRLFLSGRAAPAYSGYVVAREGERRAQYERGDSLVRAVVFGEPGAPAP